MAHNLGPSWKPLSQPFLSKYDAHVQLEMCYSSANLNKPCTTPRSRTPQLRKLWFRTTHTTNLDPHVRKHVPSHSTLRRVHVKIVAVLRLRQGLENWEGYVCQTDHPKKSSSGGTARNTDASWGYRRMVLCKLYPSEQACAKKILYSPSRRDQPIWPPIDECRWRSQKSVSSCLEVI